MDNMVERTPRHFLNVGQAAEYLGVSAASLRNWSDHGRVPVYRTPGGQRRYRVTDLDKFLENSGPGVMQILGVFHPAESPAARSYDAATGVSDASAVTS